MRKLIVGAVATALLALSPTAALAVGKARQQKLDFLNDRYNNLEEKVKDTERREQNRANNGKDISNQQQKLARYEQLENQVAARIEKLSPKSN